jgi:Site-specific recombinase XerD
MGDDWIKFTKAPGIYYREDPKKTKPGSKQKDRYWRLFYKYCGKPKGEVLGWESEDWPESVVMELSAKLAGNRAKNIPPRTFAELREINQAKITEKEEAQAEAEAKEEQAAAYRKTFAEVWPLYKENRKGAVYNERTLYDEEKKWEKWLEPEFGDTPLSELKPIQITNFIAECKNPTQIKKERGSSKIPAPRAAKTIAHYINLLSQIWLFGKEHGFCSGDNPARTQQVKKITPKSASSRSRFLTKEEADKLLAELKKKSVILWAKCVVMLYSGLRPIELHNLHWIDVTENSIRVLREVKTVKGKTRIINLSSHIKKALEEIRPSNALPSDLIFPPTKRKNGTTSIEISDTFDRVVKNLGFNDGVTNKNDRIVAYSLRHTFASWLVQKGVPLYTVAKLMGHSTTTITERYAHLAPSDMSQAIEKLE